MAVTTHITYESTPDMVYKLIDESDYTEKVDLSDVSLLNKQTKIFVNGTFEYICKNVSKFYNMLISNKRCGIINIYTSISFNPDLNEINIYTDGGRCCRPLYIMDNGALRISKSDVQNVQNKSIGWMNLLIGGLKY